MFEVVRVTNFLAPKKIPIFTKLNYIGSFTANILKLLKKKASLISNFLDKAKSSTSH